MTFPFYLELFGVPLHPHVVFEALGYFVGARCYFWLRCRGKESPLPLETNLWLLAGCIIGALLGSKALAWVESFEYYRIAARADWHSLVGGKTIVGGLLGGWAGVEVAKRANGVTRTTGDLFVYPIALGNAIGRIGCFLTGLGDHTFGLATTLLWGVDFGDRVHRHPTQLYESLFVLIWAGSLWLATRRIRLPDGGLFRLYLAGYLAFRFAVEFIKPRETWFLALSAIQLASLAGFAFCCWSYLRVRRHEMDGAGDNHHVSKTASASVGDLFRRIARPSCCQECRGRHTNKRSRSHCEGPDRFRDLGHISLASRDCLFGPIGVFCQIGR